MTSLRTLPLPGQHQEPGDPAGCAPVRVAVVEDDPEQRRYARDEIARHPELTVAGLFETGEDAIVRLALCRPNVVLVDIGLPGLSGIEVVRGCQPGMAGVQFMMLTVVEDVPKVFAALSAGATGYLLKKDIPIRLLSAVKELRAGGSPMSSTIARQVVLAFRHDGPPRAGASPTEPEAASLTDREREILGLLAAGRLYKEIADRLGIGLGTVNTHIRRIYEKLHAHNRTEAVRRARGQ